MTDLIGSFGTPEGLTGTLGTNRSLVGELGGSLIPGPQGEKGDKGEKGERGDKGDQGAKGDRGDQGPTGDTGPRGETGPVGPKGDKGDPGPKGDKGDTGATGPVGPQGEKGDQGPKGDVGQTGPVGPKGEKGDPGDNYILTAQDKQDIAAIVDDKMVVRIGSQYSETAYRFNSTFNDILNALTRGVNVVVVDSDTIYPYVGFSMIQNELIIAFGTSVTYDNLSVFRGYLILQSNIAAKSVQQATIPTKTSDLTNDSGFITDTPVDDVQVNGSSIVSNGIANIPIASTSAKGVVGVDPSNGIRLTTSQNLITNPPSSASVKTGTNATYPLVSSRQHEATFYGLAKAAGHDEKNSTLPLGQYTDEAKEAIRTMLGIDTASLVAEIREALNL